jgi:hypothetical protein
MTEVEGKEAPRNSISLNRHRSRTTGNPEPPELKELFTVKDNISMIIMLLKLKNILSQIQNRTWSLSHSSSPIISACGRPTPFRSAVTNHGIALHPLVARITPHFHVVSAVETILRRTITGFSILT